jgi:hypothetical protein
VWCIISRTDALAEDARAGQGGPSPRGSIGLSHHGIPFATPFGLAPKASFLRCPTWAAPRKRVSVPMAVPAGEPSEPPTAVWTGAVVAFWPDVRSWNQLVAPESDAAVWFQPVEGPGRPEDRIR